MKVGIMTYHFVNNFGGSLQAYALSKTIEKLNNEKTIIIDFRHPFIRFTDSVRLFPITSNVKEFMSGIMTFVNRKERVKKFKDFQQNYFTLSKRYNSSKELYKDPPALDKVVFGSDQIWNSIVTFGVEPAYFGDFIKDKYSKFSYAASFGVDSINDTEKEKLSKYIVNMGDISVREKEGQKIIKNLTGRDAKKHVDPTFLLTRKEWEDICIKPECESSYILVYMMQPNDRIYDYTKKLKEKLNKKVIIISRYGYKPGFADEVIVGIGPREFLGLFSNADFVCTNSFHGLVFSIIFEKDFFVIPSNRFNSRINNTIELFDINIENSSSILKNDYDKKKVRDIIEMERKKSMDYLKKNLYNNYGVYDDKYNNEQ